jgi:hypothetical protein
VKSRIMAIFRWTRASVNALRCRASARKTEKIVDGVATPDSFSLQNLLAEKLIALGSKRF